MSNRYLVGEYPEEGIVGEGDPLLRKWTVSAFLPGHIPGVAEPKFEINFVEKWLEDALYSATTSWEKRHIPDPNIWVPKYSWDFECWGVHLEPPVPMQDGVWWFFNKWCDIDLYDISEDWNLQTVSGECGGAISAQDDYETEWGGEIADNMLLPFQPGDDANNCCWLTVETKDKVMFETYDINGEKVSRLDSRVWELLYPN